MVLSYVFQAHLKPKTNMNTEPREISGLFQLRFLHSQLTVGVLLGSCTAIRIEFHPELCEEMK